MYGKSNHMASLILQGFNSEVQIFMNTCIPVQKIVGRIGEAEAH